MNTAVPRTTGGTASFDRFIALPPALEAPRDGITGEGPSLVGYGSAPLMHSVDKDATPLLLIHSVNAVASAAELRPIFERYRLHRPVLAIDLPGFGSSQRGQQQYTPALMVQAILRAALCIKSRGFMRPIDVVGLSLGCEFVTEAALAQPERFRSLALISPTGLEAGRTERWRDGRTRDVPLVRRTLASPVGEPIFRILTTRPSIRWFLERTWGSPQIDERLLEYGHLSARQPGARCAAAAFIGGALFTRGIAERYALLPMPVWLAHGVRGQFADMSGLARLGPLPHWTTDAFSTGAMPHVEVPRTFTSHYDAFSTRVGDRSAWPVPLHSAVCGQP
jgi:pimeloyl-ACP methyl ester carboxylesterase